MKFLVRPVLLVTTIALIVAECAAQPVIANLRALSSWPTANRKA